VSETAERLLLRIPEAAQRLGLGRSTVYELIQDGQLPVIRIGKAVRIPASRLAAWVESQARSAEAERGGEVF
jgi:excisionase family DNA binding protein